jgi:hypothetical protein
MFLSPERRENIVYVMFFCQASVVGYPSLCIATALR